MTDEVSGGELTRLHTVLDRRVSTLILFDGRAATKDGYEELGAIAEAVTTAWPRLVDVILVTPQTVRPGLVPAGIRVALDVEGDLEQRYGAEAECLFLIRPDGYIGFRSQPAELQPLERHLAQIFL